MQGGRAAGRGAGASADEVAVLAQHLQVQLVLARLQPERGDAVGAAVDVGQAAGAARRRGVARRAGPGRRGGGGGGGARGGAGRGREGAGRGRRRGRGRGQRLRRAAHELGPVVGRREVGQQALEGGRGGVGQRHALGQERRRRRPVVGVGRVAGGQGHRPVAERRVAEGLEGLAQREAAQVGEGVGQRGRDDGGGGRPARRQVGVVGVALRSHLLLLAPLGPPVLEPHLKQKAAVRRFSPRLSTARAIARGIPGIWRIKRERRLASYSQPFAESIPWTRARIRGDYVPWKLLTIRAGSGSS